MTDQAIQPHQKRVIDEKADLDHKIKLLTAFIEKYPFLESFDVAEQGRLKKQRGFMLGYSEVLSERITAFASQP